MPHSKVKHMVRKGSIHCHDYDEDVFPCVQKCHFHYLGGIRRMLRMKSPGPEFKKFSQTLKKIILDSWFPEKGNNPDDTQAEKRKKIHNLQVRVRRLISNAPDEEHCRRFVKRMRREITWSLQTILSSGRYNTQ